MANAVQRQRGVLVRVRHPRDAQGGRRVGSFNVSSSMPGGESTSAGTTLPKGADPDISKAAAIHTPGNIGHSVHPAIARRPHHWGYSTDPQRREWSITRTPLGRLGTADDIAYACSIWRLTSRRM